MEIKRSQPSEPDPLPPLVTMSLNMTFFYFEVVPKSDIGLKRKIEIVSNKKSTKNFQLVKLSSFESFDTTRARNMVSDLNKIKYYFDVFSASLLTGLSEKGRLLQFPI